MLINLLENMYQVNLSKKALKDVRRISKKDKRRIALALSQLKIYPYVGKKLVGNLKGLLSYRVWPYRIVYSIDEEKQEVLVIRIAHRKEVYKKL